MCDWEDYGLPVELNNPELVWGDATDGENMNSNNTFSISLRNVEEPLTLSDREADVDEKNEKTFNMMQDEEIGLVCFMQYEVYLKSNNAKANVRTTVSSGHGKKQKRLMRRKINLVEVAARLLSMYIGYGSSKDVIKMFKCSKFSMKSVILFAHFLRTLIECSMSANRSMGEEQLCNDSDTVDSRYVKISDDMKTKVLSIISYLCPGKTITNHVMEKWY